MESRFLQSAQVWSYEGLVTIRMSSRDCSAFTRPVLAELGRCCGDPQANRRLARFAVRTGRCIPGSSRVHRCQNMSTILLDQVSAAAPRFSRLPVGTSATLLCTIIPYDDLPLLSVGSQLLQALGEIKADLEIDIISADGPEEREDQ